MSELHSPWDDVNVKTALKKGRPMSDIALIQCDKCHNYAYYNDGSHFSCGWCDYSVDGEHLDAILDAGEAVTLEDYADIEASAEDVP